MPRYKLFPELPTIGIRAAIVPGIFVVTTAYGKART
jgi:hypothetical protein